MSKFLLFVKAISLALSRPFHYLTTSRIEGIGRKCMNKILVFVGALLISLCGTASAAPSSDGNYWCSGSSLPHSGSESAQALTCAQLDSAPGHAGTLPGFGIDGTSCPSDFEDGNNDNIGDEECSIDWHWVFQGQIINNTSKPSVASCINLTEYDPSTGGCPKFVDRYGNKPLAAFCLPCIEKQNSLTGTPHVGDPIYPQTGSQRQDVGLGIYLGKQSVGMTYDSIAQVPEVNGGLKWLVPSPLSFGRMWHSNLHRSIALEAGGNGAGSAFSAVAIDRGAASLETASVAGFASCDGTGGGGSGAYVSNLNPSLTVKLTGVGSGGTLIDGIGMTEEVYDSGGAITSLAQATGGSLNFVYTSGLLTTVTDQFGRQVSFAYEKPPGANSNSRINIVTAPDGVVTALAYDAADNLNTITWPDNSVQKFLYENSSMSWALTGVLDESNRRFSTFGYDAQGRVNGTFLGAGVDNYSVSYDAAPSWAVSETKANGLLCRDHHWVQPQNIQLTKPAGSTSTMNTTVANGMLLSSGQTQPAGSGTSAASSTVLGYDATGNLTSFDDFNGSRSCFSYDSTRNIPLVIVEGLPGGSSGKACSTNLSSYAPSPADTQHPERKTTTVWHPDWVLKAREAGPKKITSWVYNGQPDPIAGTTASCVSPATTLPDGKPLAVLCARYEQATTDATGALGLSAVVTGATRAWTYTYNQYGEVLTETTPKQSATDSLSHTTTYTYYPTTSFSGSAGHTMGDLQTITNPLGQVTTFTSYDKAGRLLSSQDANATVTSTTYWPRGWVHTQTVTPASGSALTTTYDYWPTGLLKTVTMPDASTLNYGYDDAHRLTDVIDAAGNKVHYVLDNVGNRTSEQVSDASGNLAASVSRVFDALNRVQTQTGALH